MLRFKVIRKMEFSSDRKRMSILVLDLQDSVYKLYIKGADNVIKERLNEKCKGDSKMMQETDQFLTESSMNGFRTLLIGMKVLDQAEVDEFLREC